MITKVLIIRHDQIQAVILVYYKGLKTIILADLDATAKELFMDMLVYITKKNKN